jgi:hypothetical protein
MRDDHDWPGFPLDVEAGLIHQTSVYIWETGLNWPGREAGYLLVNSESSTCRFSLPASSVATRISTHCRPSYVVMGISSSLDNASKIMSCTAYPSGPKPVSIQVEESDGFS